MHVDESDRREDFTLPFVIEAARERRVPNVTVAHISSLSVQTDDVARSTIAALADADVNVVVNPIIVKITRLSELLDAGVSVMFGSDNLRDPFYPLGAANPLDQPFLPVKLPRWEHRKISDGYSMRSPSTLPACWDSPHF
jgi:cytosine deaminase